MNETALTTVENTEVLPSLSGRDGNGKFAMGNRESKGNPLAQSVNKFRAAIHAAITPDDVQAVIKMLLIKAKEGNVAAAQELLSRLVGKPAAAIEIDSDSAVLIKVVAGVDADLI